jgi:acyl carrier protein
VMEKLPLTANGKVDRRALPAPDSAHSEQGVTFVAPRTAAEERMASIWAQVLGITKIGVHDNFFDVGGHSLLATQLISRLREAFGADLSLRHLFEAPTIVQLLENIERIQWAAETGQLPHSLTGEDYEEGAL